MLKWEHVIQTTLYFVLCTLALSLGEDCGRFVLWQFKKLQNSESSLLCKVSDQPVSRLFYEIWAVCSSSHIPPMLRRPIQDHLPLCCSYISLNCVAHLVDVRPQPARGLSSSCRLSSCFDYWARHEPRSLTRGSSSPNGPTTISPLVAWEY